MAPLLSTSWMVSLLGLGDGEECVPEVKRQERWKGTWQDERPWAPWPEVGSP